MPGGSDGRPAGLIPPARRPARPSSWCTPPRQAIRNANSTQSPELRHAILPWRTTTTANARHSLWSSAGMSGELSGQVAIVAGGASGIAPRELALLPRQQAQRVDQQPTSRPRPRTRPAAHRGARCGVERIPRSPCSPMSCGAWPATISSSTMPVSSPAAGSTIQVTTVDSRVETEAVNSEACSSAGSTPSRA